MRHVVASDDGITAAGAAGTQRETPRLATILILLFIVAVLATIVGTAIWATSLPSEYVIAAEVTIDQTPEAVWIVLSSPEFQNSSVEALGFTTSTHDARGVKLDERLIEHSLAMRDAGVEKMCVVTFKASHISGRVLTWTVSSVTGKTVVTLEDRTNLYSFVHRAWYGSPRARASDSGYVAVEKLLTLLSEACGPSDAPIRVERTTGSSGR